MLWLALHLPSLSLEAFCATLPGRADAADARQPVALVAEHGIGDCNAAAAARGVRAGLKRATALALAPELLLGEADATRDVAALQAVAHVALGFTPSVTLHEGPATVLMEVQASLRLFGGLQALHHRLREALAPLGHRVQIAAAPTALGAAALARWGEAGVRSALREGPAGAASPEVAEPPRFDLVHGQQATSLPALERLLNRAPVWLFGPGRAHWEALQGMGLRTLADLRALPREGLARRFGEGLLLDLDRALGHAPDPRRWLQLPARFENRLELHQRADSTEQVLAAAAVLLARLVAWAQARHGRIAAFTLSMQHEPRHDRRGGGSAPATELRIEMAEPALDTAHLQLLLRERLARVALAAPTLELRLRCKELARGAPPNGELFPTRASESVGLARLLERLRARLGDAQVQRLLPVADHRPERGSRGVPALAGPAAQHGRPTRGAASVSSPPSAAAQVRTPARRGTRVVPPAGRGAMAAATQGVARMAMASPPPGRDAAGIGHALPGGGAPSALCAPARPAQPGAMTAAVTLPLHRPAWLLPEPVPLPERHGLPVLDGEPLQLVSGPERIEAGWWDGTPAARDYFIALASDGSLVWVWRERVPPASADSGAGGGEAPWMLQGRFA